MLKTSFEPTLKPSLEPVLKPSLEPVLVKAKHIEERKKMNSTIGFSSKNTLLQDKFKTQDISQ